MRRLLFAGLAVLLSACAAPKPPSYVTIEPLSVEPSPEARSEPCPDAEDADDGIGGTGCAPEVD